MMERTRQIAANIFVGTLDKDSDPHVISNSDYVDALDILNGYGAQIGAIVFPKGNTQVVYTLPAGGNICIGCPEDKQTASAIIFIYNSLGNHRILWWKSQDALNPVRVLASGSNLRFTGTLLITHAVVVDGKMLYWTDGRYVGGAMSGQPPRELDIEAADLTDKDLEYEIYAGQPNEGQFAAGNPYSFALSNGTTLQGSFTIYANGVHENDPIGGLQWLHDELEASDLSSYINLELCECKLKITVYQDLAPAGYTQLFFLAQVADVLAVGTNFYPTPLELYHLTLAKQPPRCAPLARYATSDLFSGNNVIGLRAQFIVRYIYRTGARSAWSPVSNIALNTTFDGEPIANLNAITVDFTDARLSDPDWLFLIRAVEVAFRDGNTDEFKLIDRFDVCEIGVARQYITFLNDKLYQNVESDDVSTSAATQVLKLFDSVPLISGTMEVAADANGNNLLFLGANLEGYPCPDCVEMDVEAVPWNDDCLIDIHGTVEIINNSNYPDANPDYIDYPLDGFVVYLAGTHHYAISNNPADGTGDGRFTIPGVPRGHYVVRVASYKCSFNSVLSPRYNLTNGLEWQRTSAPIVDCAGAVANGRNQWEREIDLTAAVDEIDLAIEPGYGPITILNRHGSKRFPEVADGDKVVNMHEVYLLDNDAQDANVADRVGALNVERQMVHWAGAVTLDIDVDHNGYFYKVDAFTKGSLAPDVTITVDHISSIPLLLNLYQGDYSAMYADTLVPTPDPGTIYQSMGGGNFFIMNVDPDFTLRKKLLVLTAQDANAGPLEGVMFLVTRTTRTDVSGPNGNANIMLYAPFDNDVREDDVLIALFETDICYEYYPPYNPLDVVLPILGIFAEPGPLIISPTEFSFVGAIHQTSRYVKAGGVYDIAIVYEDEHNRTCGVSKGERLYVPFHTDGLTRYQVRWTIHSQPPFWAHHYRIVRTRNAIHQSYVQWIVKEVRYVRIPSQLESPIDTTYDNGDATHIMLRLFIPVPSASAPDLTLFWQQDGQQGYIPVQGDFVRLILNAEGEPVNTADVLFEAPVVGLYVDAEKIYAVIPATFGTLEVMPDFLVEYLTPRLNVEEVYYEGGEDCYLVLNPNQSNRAHAGPIQDQTTLPEAPAIGMLTGGDTYWRRQLYTESSAYVTEHYSPTRLNTMPAEDIGRAFIHDPDAAQIYFYNRIRFSGKYIAQSKVNDLGSFGSLDFQDINRMWGEIKWLGFANNVLLAVCQFKVQPIYVHKGQLLEFGGDTSVGRSDRVLNIADESVSDYGTHNPESVVREGGYVYAWDAYRGAVWRYSQAGVLPITQKMTKYFHDLGRARIGIGNDFVLGGYDRRHAMYLLSYYDPRLTVTVTLGYDEVKGGWLSRYSFLPEMMGRVGQEFITFRNGGLWRHHTNALYANYYGVQYKPLLQFVANAQPGAVKLFFSMRLITDRLWAVPVITVPFNLDYAAGMLSRIKAVKFVKYEGIIAANFLRDMNDTSPQFLAIADLTTRRNTALLAGRHLRGRVMIITIEANDGSLATTLQRSDVYYVPSEETNS